MSNTEWMLNEIRIQIRSVGKQISGLPDNMQVSITNECIDILKKSIVQKEPPSLDKDGCVYWDHILERTEHHD